MTRSRAFWAIVALAAALVFFWAATTQSVYDHTSPGGVAQRILGEDAPRVPHNHWLSLHIILRKAYSIVAFALVGIVVDRMLPAVRRRALRAAAIVALFSAVIEVAQTVIDHSPEGFASNVFDIACGAVGGWLGVVAARTASRAVEARSRVEPRPYGEGSGRQDRAGDGW
ncbi:MAG TPA: VanZ family protein [Candidatus Limnocylindria bacterium]|nr:VanZ family protein [Candidatus Limnocylindria bacterium]